MMKMNTMYNEKVVTCLPSYVKWTKWLFQMLQTHKLAYKADGDVNFCPSCDTVLANEQVKESHCDRCGTEVVMKNLNQWYFKITAYRDRLIQNLDHIDYPESTKKQQRAWLQNQKDWCVSRQRKWGCPIPVDGETDTLDTFVDSSFYFLRYLDPDNRSHLFATDKYKQVDLYVGGNEHACMHLIYARFIHMFLFDIGVVPVEEPFKKVIHQGVITKDGHKMGKSKGNAVNPDDYDADELRMYLMFLGHYFDGGEWSDEKIIGITRFLNRMKVWLAKATFSFNGDGKSGELLVLKDFEDKIDEYVRAFKFNKVISEFMTFYNKNKDKTLYITSADRIVQLLKVFAPGFKVR
jgi:leucyl-tRNA synthetase